MKYLIDATNPTTYQVNIFLNADGLSRIVSDTRNGGKKKVLIKANHPT